MDLLVELFNKCVFYNFPSWLVCNCLPKIGFRSLMLGLDNAGKTLLFLRMIAITKPGHDLLELDPLTAVIPTIGFNSDVVKYKNISFVLIEYSGDKRFRGLWKHFLLHCYLFIYVVDSSDASRLKESAFELENILSNVDMEARALVLIYANKQDIEGALNAEEITTALSLHNIKQLWHLQLCSALNNEGIKEGLEWASITFRNLERQRDYVEIC